MTELELDRLMRYATGPVDAYDHHFIRPLILKLLQEHAKTLKELAGLEAEFDKLHKELLEVEAANHDLC